MTQEQLAVLKSSEWFAALDPATQQAVITSSRVLVLAAGVWLVGSRWAAPS